MDKKLLTGWDSFTVRLFPKWTMARVAARLALRHYEAAQPGRRTSAWRRTTGDADVLLRGSLIELRIHARDLIRNNGWARRAQRKIGSSVVGWGITPKAVSDNSAAAKAAMDIWRKWANTVECDSDGRKKFSKIQSLCMRSIAESGEVLIRRRWRRPTDGLTIPIQLQVLEADFLDQSRNYLSTETNGPTIQGVEFDLLGRRTAYWLWDQHPGSGRNYKPSRRIPASEVLHIYYEERPGQSRGVSWFAPAILNLKDFDEYEDATLMRQKIASCFAGFITDIDGTSNPLGAASTDPEEPLVETLEPGLLSRLKPGQNIEFADPPAVGEGGFTERTLRKVAKAMGITYEDLTGDYSQSNFSSARMARLDFWENVTEWRENMLIPQLCEGVWAWMIEAAQLANLIPIDEPVTAVWSAPPMAMIEPDKEGLANQRLVRIGAMTHDQMIREQGGDPEAHWQEYADGLKTLDRLKIILDSDPRKTTSQGQEQASEAEPAAPPKKQIPDS